MKIIKHVLLIFALFISSCSSVDDRDVNANLETKKIFLSYGAKKIPITVELATTPKQKEIGLMFRESLDMDKGMLFIFSKKTSKKFWMKNTLISLDIIFLNSNKIIGIAEDTTPHDLTPVGPNALSDNVLEVPAGFVKKHGIINGWELQIHPIKSTVDEKKEL